MTLAEAIAENGRLRAELDRALTRRIELAAAIRELGEIAELEILPETVDEITAGVRRALRRGAP